jgi:DNA-binding response OmpR family regulator
MAQYLTLYLQKDSVVMQQIDIQRIQKNNVATSRVPLIMLIEDDELVRLSLDKFFSLFDFTLKKYASAEEALQEIRNGVPDIIITDYNLPGMNGIELAKSIRKIGITTPVVLLSAIRHAVIENNSLALGIDAIFTKPVNILDLKDKVEQLLLV